MVKYKIFGFEGIGNGEQGIGNREKKVYLSNSRNAINQDIS